MKREIKFRGKDESGEWIYGNFVRYIEDDEYVTCIVDSKRNDVDACVEFTQVNPDTVGQYTGLKDKNDKEIYEGDIIREIDSARAFEVVYEAPEFCMADNIFGYRFLNHPENFEVIGNIHDNKELL